MVRALINCCYNNSLTMAPKKDEFGNMTLKRLCLNLRYINKLLPDDKYPILCIRAIFEALVDAIIFTILDLKSVYHRFLIIL